MKILKRTPTVSRSPSSILKRLFQSSLAIALFAAPLTAESEFVILANKDAPIQDIGKKDLARLYLSKTKKIGSNSYRVVNLGEEEVKQKFLYNLTSMSQAEMEHHYIALELRGEGEKPKEVSSTKNMIFLLIKSDQIIGWLPHIDYEKLPSSLKKHMKVIRIHK